MVTLNKVNQGVSGHWSQPLETIAKLSTLNADGVLEEEQICHHEEGLQTQSVHPHPQEKWDCRK